MWIPKFCTAYIGGIPTKNVLIVDFVEGDLMPYKSFPNGAYTKVEPTGAFTKNHNGFESGFKRVKIGSTRLKMIVLVTKYVEGDEKPYKGFDGSGEYDEVEDIPDEVVDVNIPWWRNVQS